MPAHPSVDDNSDTHTTVTTVTLDEALEILVQAIGGMVEGNPQTPTSVLLDRAEAAHQAMMLRLRMAAMEGGRQALIAMASGADKADDGPLPVIPAVPVKESIAPDGSHIICLEDGTKRRDLGRYLREAYGLSPDDYRRRWGLPGDYPMKAAGPAPARRPKSSTSQSRAGETGKSASSNTVPSVKPTQPAQDPVAPKRRRSKAAWSWSDVK